jgi:hypothetical protein
MFRYAVARTVAERKGYNFFIDKTLWCGHGLFDLDFGVIDGDIKQTFYDTDQQEFNPAIYDVEDFTLLWGFFQSEKYFDHDKVRQWFKVILEVPPFADNYCLIHFRGKDYNDFPQSIIQLPESYYNEGKTRMHQINPEMKFLIITDDKIEAERRFPNDEISNKTSIEDFALLNKAKYLIISNSTFSWWAAWLNLQNVVIAPTGWYNYNRDKNIFYPTDIKVDRFIWI